MLRPLRARSRRRSQHACIQRIVARAFTAGVSTPSLLQLLNVELLSPSEFFSLRVLCALCVKIRKERDLDSSRQSLSLSLSLIFRIPNRKEQPPPKEKGGSREPAQPSIP